MMPPYRHRLWIATVAVFAACGDPAAVKKPGAPAAVNILEGQDLTGAVGQELSTALEAEVVDAAGNPVAGQIVNFRVVAGGGSVFAGSAISTSAGIVKERWTLGTIATDTQRLEARAIDQVSGDPLVFATFRATAIADAPFTVEKSAGDGQAMVVGTVAAESLTVRARDRYGNPTPNAPVTWSVESGGGSVSPATSSTNAQGYARTILTAGTTSAVQQTVKATVGTVAPQTFIATATAAAASALQIAQAAVGAYAGAVFDVQPSIRVVDANGNATTTGTAPVTLTVTSGATVIGTATKTPNQGLATFTNVGLSGMAADYTLTYTATLGGTTKTITQPVTLLAGAASKYLVTSSAPSAVVGSQGTVSAQLVDVSNNPVTTAGKTVTWVRVGAGGSFATATSTTNASGFAQTTFTLNGSYTHDNVQLAATDQDALTGSAAVVVTRGPATKLAFLSQPSSTSSGGSPGSIRAGITDSFGNTIPTESRTVTVTLTGSGATLGGTTSTVTVDGVATFSDLTVTGEGSGFTLEASASPGNLTAASSLTFGLESITTLATIAPELGKARLGVPGLVLAGDTLWFVTAADFASSNGGIYRLTLADNQRVYRSGIATGFFTGRSVTDGVSLYTLQQTGSNARTASVIKTTFSGGGATFSLQGNPNPAYPPNSALGRDCHAAAQDIEIDAGYLYVGCFTWNSYGNTPRLVRMSASDGTKLILTETFTGGGPRVMALGDGFIYYIDGTQIKRIAKDGSSGPTTLVTGLDCCTLSETGPRRLAAVGSTLYWAERGDGGATSGSIRSAPIAGGTPTTRASGLGAARFYNLTADGDYLYFIDAAGIKRMSLTTYAVQTVVEDVVYDFVLTSSHIYWKRSGGTDHRLMRMPKPGS